MSKPCFNDAYKSWRNKARRYSLVSILDRAFESLRYFESRPGLENAKSAPWLTALIVKWVCQDRMQVSYRKATSENFDELRQNLWSLPEEVESLSGSIESGHLFMRRIIRPQLGFQQPVSPDFMRTALLISRLDQNHRLARLFRERMGIDVSDFLDLSYATYAAIIHGKKDVPREWFDSLRASYGHSVDVLINLISTDVKGLQVFFRAQGSSRKLSGEMFEFPILSRYPFLNENGVLKCWSIGLFFRGMELIVHRILADAGQAYADPFSIQFERHVIDECIYAGLKFTSESEIKIISGMEEKVPDGMFELDGGNVFVESKAGIFNEPVMIAGTKDIFSHKTRSLQSAFVQASTRAKLLADRIPDRFGGKVNYLIVVTNLELSIGRGDRFEKMLPDGCLDSQGYLRGVISTDRIYIVSIADFERLIGAIRAGDLNLVDFLNFCIDQDNDSLSSKLMLSQHLDEKKVKKYTSRLLAGGINEIESRLKRNLIGG